MKKKLLRIMTMLILATSASMPVFADEIMGDVNEDGIITAADAALVLNYVLDNSTEINVEKAKVFADGKITAANSAAILAKVLDASFVYPDSEDDMPTNIPKIDVPDDMVNGINLNDYEIVREYNFEDIAPGVYTEDIVVGDMIIQARETSPVYIDEVDVTINGRHYTRKMRRANAMELLRFSKVKGSDYFNILLCANSPKYAAESAFNIQSIIKKMCIRDRFIYPCTSIGGSLVTMSIMASLTDSGGTIEGLPREKSKTFSLPSFAIIFLPSSNMARIAEPFLDVYKRQLRDTASHGLGCLWSAR